MCGFTYYFNPSSAVVAIIKNSDGDILVTTRAHEPAKGSYDLPGGFVDSYETAEECIAREIKEECNLDVESVEYLFSLPNIYTYSNFDVHTLDMFFECTVKNFESLQADDDVASLQFISAEEIDFSKFGLTSIRKDREIFIKRLKKELFYLSLPYICKTISKMASREPKSSVSFKFKGMIKEFAVENFLSFKDRQEISFEATSDKTSEADLIYKIVHPVSGSVTRILRAAVIYGANASGKTNILCAMAKVFRMLLTPSQDKDDRLEINTFGLRKDCNSIFEINFFIDDIEYEYSVEFSDIVYHEKLRFNPKGAMSLFYSREYDKEKDIPIVKFGDNADIDAATKKTIISNTYNNHTVLSTINKLSLFAPQFSKVIM